MADTRQNLTTEGAPAYGLSTETGRPRAVDLSDKLTIINQALINTGNNPVSIGDEGTSEWIVASSAWDQRLPELLHKRNWKFATRIAALDRISDSEHPGYKDVFAKPSDSLFLVDVYRPDVAAMVYGSLGWVQTPDLPRRDNLRFPPLAYDIIGDKIYTNAPLGASAVYVPFPVGSQPWSAGFVSALRLKIEANIYRALNEDMQAAAQVEKYAEQVLQEAAARVEQEAPRRVAFRSGLNEARRYRGGGGSGGRW